MFCIFTDESKHPHLMKDVNNLLFNNASSAPHRNNLDIESMISHIAAASRISNQSMMIIDFDEHIPLYMSNNMIYLNEALEGDYKRICANPYWSLISDSTLFCLLSLREGYLTLWDQIPQEEYSKHICVFEYPITIRNHEFYINQTFTPLWMRNDGITGIGAFSIKPSSKREISCIVITPSGRRWLFDFKEERFEEFTLGANLSATEKALLQRARKGMSNGEIAADMYISLSTVKSHKLRIFKKLNVNSITEAIVVACNYHLL